MGGLTLAEPNTELRRSFVIPASIHGAVVTNVELGSPAARAGIRPGDVVMELNRPRDPSQCPR